MIVKVKNMNKEIKKIEQIKNQFPNSDTVSDKQFKKIVKLNWKLTCPNRNCNNKCIHYSTTFNGIKEPCIECQLDRE
jgi:hypothetical protein